MPRSRFLPFYTGSLLLVALTFAGPETTRGLAPSRLLAARMTAPPAADTLRPAGMPVLPLPPLLQDSTAAGYRSLLHPPPEGWSAFWARGLEERLRAQRDSLLTRPLRIAARDTAAFAAPLHPEGDALFRDPAERLLAFEAEPERAGGGDAAGAQPTGLEIRVQGRSALGGGWNRMRPCSGLSTLYCETPLVPHLDPELQLSAVVRGSLFDRVHVAVDYDAAREFDAANQIHLHYQGEAGELLRRVEVGNVALALPASRFLTRGVPAGNWGVRALGQAGPLELQALWAQQSGAMTTREFRQRAGDAELLQQASAAWDDAGYAAGQFFFLFDPAEIRGYPHLDVRALSGAEAPARLLPQGGIQLFRYEGGPPRQDGSTMLLRALPREPEHAREAVTAPFRLLQAGVDYQLHPSGTWLMLQSPLREEEALGVAYLTLAGDSVGQLAAGSAAAPGGPREIRLLRGVRATHQPGSATWPLEMRHLYRISGSEEVDAASVRLVISRGEQSGGDLGRTHPFTGQPLTYLQLFGLDEDAPLGELDAARLFHPREEEPGTLLRGTYLVFPTLRPFAAPPSLPAVRLSAEQAAQLLGGDANPGIYEAGDERARRAAARFRLAFTYTTRGSGLRSAFSLGAIGIREGSERIYLGGRLLERGADYQIQYEIGEVQLLDPNLLLVGAADTELRATFEQQPIFGIAPTSVAGFTARYPLGERGELNFVGLSQREQAFERRPTLGAEPASLLLGGMSGKLSLGAAWLDRIFGTDLPPPAPPPQGGRGELPGALGVAPERTGNDRVPRSEILLSGELAMSLPDPYREGIAYLEDFEERDEISIPLWRQAWRVGSAPASAQRAEGVLPLRLDAASAGSLVWQHDYLDEAGRVRGSLRAAEIDAHIRVAGNTIESSVLYLTFEGGGTQRAWRSLTSVLSPGGRDLRNQEYLEFYVRGGERGALVLDLGTVSEDAFVTDALGRTGGTDAAGRPWGLGVLDREWDPASEVWSAEHDRRGLWDATCQAEAGAVYPRGDPRANCTRGNGLQDTEDLNGNGVLDTDERVLRHVVRLDDPRSPYLVRDTTETRTGFRLYRIPIQRDATVNATPAEIHNVRHLRMTLVAEGSATLALARMRLVGSRWEKRGEGGITGGLIEAERPPAFPGRLEVGPVSRLTDGEYLSPPGVVDQPRDPGAALELAGGIEFNEKALRLRYSGLAPGDRAEVYRAYEGMPRNFLAYRQLRLWALAREGRWDPEGGGEQLVLRVGSGPDNYYLYRTPLRRAGAPRGAQDWGPEVVIDFVPWQRLRAEAERLLLERPPGTTEPLVLWSADSTHAVVIGERGRAPNLAAVREISISVWNGGGTIAAGELWINDIRLGAAESRPGVAGEINLSVRGGSVLQTDLSYSQQGAHFRQLDGLPYHQGEGMLALNTSLQLGELLPGSWGLSAPLSASHQRAASEPLFLEQTDLDARLLGDVRRPEARRTRVHLQLGRRAAPGGAGTGILSPDGLQLRAAYHSADQSTPYTAIRAEDLDVTLEYHLRPAARTLGLLPDLSERLPTMLRGSLLAGGLSGLRLRWSPEALMLSTGWSGRRGDYRRFPHLLLSHDEATGSQQSLQQRLAQQATLRLRPFASLGADLSLRSTRDLLSSERLNPRAAGQLEAERLRLAGLDLGREADRSLTSRLTWTPRLAGWLTAQATASGSFVLDQNPGYVGPHPLAPEHPHPLTPSPASGRGGTGLVLEARGPSPPNPLSLLSGARSAAPFWERGNRSAVLPSPLVGEGSGEGGPLTLLRSFGNHRALSTRFVVEPQALARTLVSGAAEDSVAPGGWLLRSLQPMEVSWGRVLESRYDRAAGDPGLGYQLGLGGREHFRALHADSATRLVDGTEWSLRSELALPAALRLRAGYGARHGELLGRRSERFDREVTWPDLTLDWSRLPLPLVVRGMLRNAAIASGYNRRLHRQADRGSGEGRMAATTRVPLSVSAVWEAGIVTTYRAEWAYGAGETPFARTRRIGQDHSLSLGGSLPAPGPLAPALPEPLAVALRFTQGDHRECRLSPELAVCSERNEFLSYRERILGLQLDTRAAGMGFGLQLDRRERQSRIGERGASSQFTFGLFGQFNFSAGTTP